MYLSRWEHGIVSTSFVFLMETFLYLDFFSLCLCCVEWSGISCLAWLRVGEMKRFYFVLFLQDINLMKPITNLMFCGSPLLGIQDLEVLFGMILTELEVDAIVGTITTVDQEAAAVLVVDKKGSYDDCQVSKVERSFYSPFLLCELFL